MIIPEILFTKIMINLDLKDWLHIAIFTCELIGILCKLSIKIKIKIKAKKPQKALEKAQKQLEIVKKIIEKKPEEIKK